MDTVIEKTGKTVEEAITLALKELDVEKDDVSIEVLDQGTKGLLGILGKQARVRVTRKELRGDAAAEFLLDILEYMGIEADIEIEEDEECLKLDIVGNDSGIVIGRRGETLDSLQYLTSLVVNKNQEEYKRVVIDVENYREKRKDTLIKLAKRLADKVVSSRRSVTLEPMNPYERRIIHSTLQDNKKVKTYSVGDEPNRKVVICVK